ncbi:MAG: hypothetical protein CVU57_29515 [Deltaproteobacteria bacterium HGW-Deltaproteobacteria-15]|nr:MAG: hypothetical protein CVU57_29515 [Deltaproteobacteria bacterium HGW-Deltaproteobacteria-15]
MDKKRLQTKEPAGGAMEIKLEPTLSTCIETAAKREYERVLGILLKGKQENKELEETLELLRLFLESADFGQLRSLSEKPLLDDRQVEFVLRSTNSERGYEVEMKSRKRQCC